MLISCEFGEVDISIPALVWLRRNSACGIAADSAAAVRKTLSWILLGRSRHRHPRPDRARCHACGCGGLRASNWEENCVGLFFEQLVRIAKISRCDVQLDSRSRQNSVRAANAAFGRQSTSQRENVFTSENHCR